MSESELADYVRLVAEGRGLLKEAGTDEVRPVREILDRAGEAAADAERARAVFSKALATFPLHPYLLTWRANAAARAALGRVEVSSSELQMPDDAEIERDLRLAIEVAPDYVQPRIDLAFHLMNYRDDARAAEPHFRVLVAGLSARLCECVVGLVTVLREMNMQSAADHELAHWLQMFPDDAELQKLARRGGAG